MRDAILDVISKIPDLKSTPPDGIQIEQLGGQTNSNYKLTIGAKRFVLRIAGAGTDKIINRRSDEANSAIAAEIGISTKVIFSDQKSGVMLREFVEGSALAAESFRDPGIIARAAKALHTVHSSGRVFESRFSILEKLAEYEWLLHQSGGPLPIPYPELARRSQPARDAIAALQIALAPCHNDLVAANFLDAGERLLILDWEYSGMNDPIFDLAALAAEVFFSTEEENLLLRSYFEKPVPAEFAARLSLYRALWNQWVTMWSMVQIANWNVNDDFWKWGMLHFNEFRLAVENVNFENDIITVRRSG